MKRFLKYALYFSIPFLGYAILFEWQCRSVTAFSKKKDYMLSHLSEVNYLATGTSHIEFGVHSKSEPRIFNWGAAGQSFGYEHALLERYIENLPHLKTMLIEVSETRLLLNDEKEEWSSNVYWIHYGLPYNVNVWNPKSYFHITQAYDFFKPIVHQALLDHENHVQLDEQGYAIENHDGRFEELQYDQKKIASSFKMVYDFKVDNQVIDYNVGKLKSTIKLLQSKGIEVVLIHPPFYQTFIAAMPAEWVRRSNEIFQELSESEKVRYWDFTHAIEDRPELFFNDNHLNVHGAELWTAQLLDSLKN